MVSGGHDSRPGEAMLGRSLDAGSTYAPPPAARTRPVKTIADWNAGAFERTAGGALAATAVVGIAVALAPVIPLPLRAPAIALAFIIWIAMVLRATVGAARTARIMFAGEERAPIAIACVGIAAALLVGMQLAIIRTMPGRHGFTWIIDWRYALEHAQAIARYGGVDHALDYAGAPIDFPVGPAWLAAAVQRVFGFGLGLVLFGFVPALCTLSIVTAGMRLLRGWGVLHRFGAAAVALALALPFATASLPTAARGLAHIASPFAWRYLPTDIALGSLLALAVGTASLAILLAGRDGRGSLALGAAGLASLAELRPQYLAGFAVLAVLLGKRDAGNRKRDLMVLAGVLAGVVLLGVMPPGIRTFESARWLAGAERGRYVEPLRLTTAVAVAAAVAWWLARRADPITWRAIGRALAACAIAVLVVSLLVHFVGFPIRSDVLANARALGIREDLAARLRQEMARALEPARLLLLMTSFAILVAAAARAPRAVRAVATVLGALVVLSPLALFARSFGTPPADYAAADDEGLRAVLRRVAPRDGALLLSSDIADPANDWARDMRGVLLTAYGGRAFYVSNVRYVHYARPDAPGRVRAVRAFFGAPWSPWHDAWSARVGVTHVLVHDRCPPAWLNAPGVPLREIARAGGWTAYVIDRRPAAAYAPMPAPVAEGEVKGRYGRAGCI